MSNPLPFLPLIYLFICFPFFFYFVMLKSQNASHGYALCFAPFALSASSSTYRFVYFFFVQSMNYYFEFSCVFLFWGSRDSVTELSTPIFFFSSQTLPPNHTTPRPTKCSIFPFFLSIFFSPKTGKRKMWKLGERGGKGGTNDKI